MAEKLLISFDKKLKSYNLPHILNVKTILAALIILLILIVAALISNTSVTKEILTYKVEQKNFISSISESGELRAKKSLSISAPEVQVNLKILYIIPEGLTVSPGDTVVKFDPSELQFKLNEASASLQIALSEKKKLLANQKASMAQMESNLKSAELSYELSKLKLEQIKFEADAVQRERKLEHQKNELSYLNTKQEYESKKIIQEAELDKINLEIEQKEGSLTEAKLELEKLILITPAKGLVVYGYNYSNDGQKFAFGQQVHPRSTIIQLPDMSHMESVTFVNEVDVSKVTIGQDVLVTLDAYQDTSFHGKISHVEIIGRRKSYNQNIKIFEVLVDLIDKSEVLKPGMTTRNQIIVRQIPNVYYVPHEAVFRKNETDLVYVMNGSSYDEVEIELGEKSEDYVIISGEIEEGDFVALADPTSTEKNEQNSVQSINSD